MIVERLKRICPWGMAGLIPLFVACGDGPTDPSPTVHRLSVGATVEGNLRAGEVVTYEIDAERGTPLRILLLARSGRRSDNLVAEVVAVTQSGFDPITHVFSRGADTVLEDQASDWFTVPDVGTYQVRVRGATGADGGPYTLRLVARNLGPETLDAVVAIGDTITGEAIDFPGDVDEFAFKFQPSGGWMVVAFLQALSGSAEDVLQLEVVDSISGRVLGGVTSRGNDGHFSAQRVLLPTDGTYLVRIRSTEPTEDRSRGPYRFLLHHVNSSPENTNPELAVGDTSAVEAIDRTGDVDEFYFYGTAGQELNVLLQGIDTFADPIRLEVIHVVSVLGSVTTVGADESLDRNNTGAFVLPKDGQYTVRISGSTIGVPGANTGRYRFELYRIDRKPESSGVSVTVGGGEHGERIDRPGDVDEYALELESGQAINVFFTTAESDDEDVLILEVVGPGGYRLACALSEESAVIVDDCPAKVTAVITAPETGVYTVRVRAGRPRSTRTGAYRFEIHPIVTTPESVPQVIELDRWVVGESIDRPGDVDEFHFTGSAGSQLVIFTRRGAGYVGKLLLQVLPGIDPREWSSPFGLVRIDPLFPSTGRFSLPETGTYTVQVTGADEGASGFGPYEFIVRTVDAAPETAPSTYTIGDTVSVEAIDPMGDRDEFVFDAVEGEVLEIVFESSESGGASTFELWIRNDRTGAWVAHVPANQTEARWFVVPSTDRYTIRIESMYASSGDPSKNTTGPYRFALLRW